jgi:hypothetical protein
LSRDQFVKLSYVALDDLSDPLGNRVIACRLSGCQIPRESFSIPSQAVNRRHDFSPSQQLTSHVSSATGYASSVLRVARLRPGRRAIGGRFQQPQQQHIHALRYLIIIAFLIALIRGG